MLYERARPEAMVFRVRLRGVRVRGIAGGMEEMEERGGRNEKMRP